MTVKDKSAVEEILRGLEEEATKQKKTILRNARNEARRIISKAKEKAEEEYTRIFNQKTQKLQAEVNRIIRSAEVEREKILSEVRLKLLKEAFKYSLKEIERIRGTEKYKRGLRSIIEEVLSEFGDRWKTELTPELLAEVITKSNLQGFISYEDALYIAKTLIEKSKEALSPELSIILQSMKRNAPDIIIECNPKDMSFVEKIIKDKGLNVAIEPNPKITGGIIMYSTDRRILIDSSLEARLRKLRRLFSKELIEMFF